jgi:YVTN family beta-propeller protein
MKNSLHLSRRTALVATEAAVAVAFLVSACSGGSPATTASSTASNTGSSGASSSAVGAAASGGMSTSGGISTSAPGTMAGMSGGASGPSSSGTSGTAVSAAPLAAAGAGTNVYSQAGAGMLTDVTRRAKPMVYVPNTIANTVNEVDPTTFKVVRRFRVGAVPQHVVPSWDLKTLWVNDNNGNTLIPINPQTGVPGRAIPVEDPYNLYFAPDGSRAMVMAERDQRIDFRDPHSMKLLRSLPVPCKGVNHADYTADLKTFVVSCEFSGKLLVIPASGAKVQKVIDLNAVRTAGGTGAMAHGGAASSVQRGVNSMPQDVRLAPNGRTFLAADMLRNGVWEVDAATFTIRGFLPTGRGAHGIYPSRDGRSIYVSNRDEGSISVVDSATLKVRTKWKIPGGGSPDMGGVSADGKTLWLSGRSNSVVYVFDTTTGVITHRVRTDAGPHGLCVWPQPGRFSLGHTGNMR